MRNIGAVKTNGMGLWSVIVEEKVVVDGVVQLAPCPSTFDPEIAVVHTLVVSSIFSYFNPLQQACFLFAKKPLLYTNIGLQCHPYD